MPKLVINPEYKAKYGPFNPYFNYKACTLSQFQARIVEIEKAYKISDDRFLPPSVYWSMLGMNQRWKHNIMAKGVVQGKEKAAFLDNVLRRQETSIVNQWLDKETTAQQGIKLERLVVMYYTSHYNQQVDRPDDNEDTGGQASGSKYEITLKRKDPK